MGPICWPFDSCIGGTEGVEFIRCIDVREPQIHEIWCPGPYVVTREFHLTARIDVGAETVKQFSTQQFFENGRRILVMGKNFINGSVKLLGIPDDAWGCELTFIEKFQYPTVPHGWGGAYISNQNWHVIPGVP